MNLRRTLSLGPAVLALSLGVAFAQPTARLSISSFAELTSGATRVVQAVAPDSKADISAMLLLKLGITNTASFDAKGPWEIAVWQQGVTPLFAVKGPIPDIKRFQNHLAAQGFLPNLAKEWIQASNGIGVIVFKSTDLQSEPEKAELKRWEEQKMARTSRTVELSLSPSDAVREGILPFLAMAKASATQAAAAKGGASNEKAMAGMFDLYFGGIETFIKGFQEFKLAAGMDSDALVLEETVSAKPQSDLAKWIRKPAHPLGPDDLNGIDPNAVFSGAVTMDEDAQLMELMRKFMRLSLDMQNQGTNETALNDMMELMGKFLPAQVSGSVFMQDHMSFAGAYRFPGADAAAVYASMKPLFSKFAKSQSGEGKFYSEASFTEKHHTAGGLPVDRFSFTMNLDSPIYQATQQKQQMEKLFPKGKMDIDYAVKDGVLLVATPDKMKDLMAASPKPAGQGMAVDGSTVALGYLNILAAMKDMLEASPDVPEAFRNRAAKLDPKGAIIQFLLKNDNQVHSEQRVPLKFLKQIGTLKD